VPRGRAAGVTHRVFRLALALNNFHLNENKDVPCWKWTTSKRFTVKSVYEHLTRHDIGPDYKRVWKAKIPERVKIFMWLRVKIFMWLMEQNAILTKNNMLSRNWHGDPCCYFYDKPENMDHLMFECPIAKVVWGLIGICFHQNSRPLSFTQYWDWIPLALPGGDRVYMVGLAAVCWAIWKGRNKTCFEKKQIKNPGEILFAACAFLRYWAGLQNEETRQLINSGVDLMMRTAMKLLSKKEGPKPVMAIQDADREEDDAPGGGAQ
jgi:hypothetical protein